MLIFRRVPVLHAVLRGSYIYQEAPRRPQVICLHQILPQGSFIWCDGFSCHWIHNHVSLVRIDLNLNADRYIFDILLPLVVPYLKTLPNANFQQDNSGQHVARRVLTYLDAQGIRLSPQPARSTDLSLFENIWLQVPQRLGHQHFPANTKDQEWHGL